MHESMLKILGNPNHPDRPPFRLVENILICTVTGDGYMVEDGIPQLLPEDRIPKEEVEKMLQQLPKSTHGGVE